MGRRPKYTAQFKARVAFEAAKGDKSINEIASEYGVHPQQVRAWKKILFLLVCWLKPLYRLHNS